MFVGVDYYPEYWPVEYIDSDLDGMIELGANIIRIGEFAWHLMEKREGEFDFSFFDMVIEKAKSRNLKIIFGTPTATFPAWLAKARPEILSEDKNGQKRVFGGRRQYCYNSHEYKKYSQRITRELMSHYKDEEAIIVWQVDNEFGHEGSDMCYCGNCHQGFQVFLKNKYEHIHELNQRWGTIFWGQTYNDFNEIPIPLNTITAHNPSLLLDYARFRSYSLNTFAHELYEIVRAEKGTHQQMTTNVSGGFFTKWFDHEENVRGLDFVSYDNYPVWGGLEKPISPAESALNLDFNRGLQDKNFWIVEQIMGAQGHDVIGYLPRPNQSALWSYQAFSRGCTDMLFFSYRSMTRGAEQFCYGLVDHDNKKGRRFKEAQSVFQTIKPYKEILHTPIQAEMAIIYDYENVWSWRSQKQTKGFDFQSEMLRLYAPFHKKNVMVDVIPVTRDLSKYKIVLVPVLQILDFELAEKLRVFAGNGGTVIFSYRTGLRDKDNNISSTYSLPGYVSDLVGGTIHEVESLSNVTKVDVKEVKTGKVYQMDIWRDLISLSTGSALFKFTDQFYEDACAVSKNQYKNGYVYYIGGGLDEKGMEVVVEDALKNTTLTWIESDEGIEVVVRGEATNSHYFIMNHTDEIKHFQDITLLPYETKIIPLHL